jgi:hypothetical protein
MQRIFTRHCIALVFALIATICYAVGFGLGWKIALAAAFVFEAAFWVFAIDRALPSFEQSTKATTERS